jgi:hypothetical protein
MSDVLRFVPLVVPWHPILDPAGKSEALTGPHKIQEKIVRAFLVVRHFPFLPFGYPLGSHPGSWLEKVRS